MSDYIQVLARAAEADTVWVNAELDQALTELDAEMERLATELQVEFEGPGVGMADMHAEHVYRLMVRHHVWDVNTEGWGLKVCDALPNGTKRGMWPVQGTGRLRKQQLVKALPEFFAGFVAAIDAAGKSSLPATGRVRAMAEAFGGTASAD
ncbi:MAG: hypothetical protein P8Y64_01415 [Gammaproteobacteria bacterium]